MFRLRRRRCWQTSWVYLRLWSVGILEGHHRSLRIAIGSAIISTCRRRAPSLSHQVFHTDVPCCSWQSDWRRSADLTSHTSLHSDCRSVIAVCLPRAHESRTGRRPVLFAGTRWAIDFPVVAAAPPRYHLVVLLLHEPPSSELCTPPFATPFATPNPLCHGRAEPAAL